MFRRLPALEIRLPDERTAPIQARRAIRKLLGEVPDVFAQDAVMLTSEIVTNATEAGGGCVLSAWYLPDRNALRVEVHDHDLGVPSVSESDSPSRLRGRGLGIVDAVASEWGIDRAGGGKSVWFELHRSNLAVTSA